EADGGPPAIMIELAPVAVSQDVEQSDLADGQLSAEAQAERDPVEPPEEEPQPQETVEQPEPIEEVVEEPVEPEEEKPEAAPEETTEPETEEAELLPDNDTAEVTLPENVPFPTARPKWLEDRPTTVTRDERP